MASTVITFVPNVSFVGSYAERQANTDQGNIMGLLSFLK
jgi:hypothetical protein